ncbi:stage II sporulation protein D [Clostridium sp. DJ247]|uniref:stage II sporulation protein D n=1 Tax=Clostridium sp. DJ247 TaxID=2726188 RepID=UPI0016255A20|nr:stage II sporulation protein D [Clostridium sp. DJ247]MBC2579842.1 stage II sporulation protein D [Clostridium sp. DJ247]
MKRRIISTPIHLIRFLLLIIISITILIVISTVILGYNGETPKLKGSIPNPFVNSSSVEFKDSNVVIPKIKVYITKTDKIEEMQIEDYVKGVVAAEMPVEFQIEALKAQAVAARTFALAHMEEFEGRKYKSTTGANVCDTVKCQVFIHKEDRLRSWPENKKDEYWNKVEKAVNETVGQVLMYNSKLVMEPYYFAVSSGKTENVQDVFKDTISYLKSVDSPGEESAPKYESSMKLSYHDFINKMNSEYPNLGLSLGEIRNQIEIKSRNKGGSVKEIKVGKITITGVKFRNIMALNSANFSIKYDTNGLQINCIGYGHGVGMSQWGANAMAKSGQDYKQILTHYYSGVNIIKLKE